jgi:archaemetzincin
VSPTTSRLRSIALVPVDRVDNEALEILMQGLPEKYQGASCEVVKLAMCSKDFLNPHTGQYHATRMLNALEKHEQEVAQDRLLAVTGLDLYVPNMNFVFGEARLPGRSAVISTNRLTGTTTYGGEALLPSRVVKEAVHELGHTLGLAHCDQPLCVMYFSNSLTDTDRKSGDHCKACLSELGTE